MSAKGKQQRTKFSYYHLKLSHNSTKEVTIFKEQIIVFYLNLQTIISMLLEKKKKGTMLQENAREPYRCGTFPCVLFLVFYSCLLFWDLARFLCSFPLTRSYLSFLYKRAAFFFFKLPFFFNLSKETQGMLTSSEAPASLGNSRVLGLKTTLEIQDPG